MTTIEPDDPLRDDVHGSAASLVVVAYRKATISLADEVLHLDEGRIVGRGTHAELLATSLDYLGVVSSLRCLEPAAQPRVAASAILAAGTAVLVVTHEPAISAIGAFLLGLPAFPQFRTAQCCAIEQGKPTFTARADLAQILPLFVD